MLFTKETTSQRQKERPQSVESVWSTATIQSATEGISVRVKHGNRESEWKIYQPEQQKFTEQLSPL